MRSFRRRLRRNRWWVVPLLRTVLLLGALVLAVGALVAWQALQAKTSLTAARDALNGARSAVERGDLAVAQAQLRQAGIQARRADDLTSPVWWRVYGRVPLAGPVVREARGMAREVRVVAVDVLPALVESVGGRSGPWQGRVDLEAVSRSAPELVRADKAVTASLVRLRALPYSRISRVDDARADLDAAVVSLAREVRDAAVMVQVLPTVLGGNRPGRVLVVAQNLAEARATGGLIGAYAVLATDRGSFRLERSGSNRDLVDTDTPVVDLGRDFTARYGRAEAAATWRSANLTPDTPSAGAILAGLAERRLDVRVDAVLLVDPVGLADVLRATGPVEFAGRNRLDADNAVRVLLHDVYEAFPAAANLPARDEVFDSALRAVLTRLQQPGISQTELARGLRHAVASGHLQVFSTHAGAQRLLQRVRAGGALVAGPPYLSVVTQDVGGSKLDYYLRREVSYTSVPSPIAVDVGAGPQDEEIATVTVRLRNTAPAKGLPPYVTFRADEPSVRRPPGQLRSWVSVYLGPGASYSRATLNGRPVSLSSHVERGLSVFSTYVQIDPGATVTLTLQARQPAVRGSTLLWRQQPRLQPDLLVIKRQGSSRAHASYYDD